MRFSLDFPWAQAQPKATAVFRAAVDDFQVTEDLGFAPSGEGEHVLLHIRKRGENTQWVADRIADFAGVKKQDVGFCGLKDRWAVTTQWFSVYLPKGPDPDWQAFIRNSEANIELLAVARHQQKLRRGAHQRNFFVIRLTELNADPDIADRLATIAARGVPNYFGEQRFGREGNNLQMAADWLEQGKRVKSRNLRGLVTSAARSWLFNQVLAYRVEQGNWNKAMDGDVLSSDGLPEGPLWGRGRSAAQADAADVEQKALEPWRSWTEGLEHCGLQQERRPLVLMPEAFSWQQDSDSLTVQFGLLPGQFATAVLREIAQVRAAQTVLA